MSDVFPTPESPGMMTFSNTFFLEVIFYTGACAAMPARDLLPTGYCRSRSSTAYPFCPSSSALSCFSPLIKLKE